MSAELTATRLAAYAKDHDLDLSFALPNEMFIDLDGTLDVGVLAARLREMSRIYIDPLAVRIRKSKSGTGLHVRLSMARPLLPLERVALHLYLGSDPKRELLRLKAIEHNTSDITPAFLDKKGEPEYRLEHWRGGPLPTPPEKKEGAVMVGATLVVDGAGDPFLEAI